jgi:hypothetical protein
MSSSINHIENILKLNNRLFLNTLAGVSDKHAKERLSSHNNPINWIAAHTVDARYLALMLLGKPAQTPYKGMFENFKAFDPSVDYPLIENIRNEWNKVSGLLADAFKSASEDHLNAETPVKSPIGVFTNAGTLSFLAQHESYDIGQMALLKKYFTKEAMSYD